MVRNGFATKQHAAQRDQGPEELPRFEPKGVKKKDLDGKEGDIIIVSSS
jgi:hypothetical protein